MTVLPILTRELRAQGHSPANYWGRVAVAAVGMLLCVPPLLWRGPVASPVAGRGAFNLLAGAAFTFCCGCCLLTADAVSRERRQGTLVLLLLTRVSRWDVLLGKLASNGLACFAGLLALLPVLGLAWLGGGTSAGEAVRYAAALINTLFLALAAGLCASSLGFDRFRTSFLSLLMMAALVLAPFVGGLQTSLPSPLGTVLQSSDLAYRASASRYWVSFCLVQALAWVLLSGAVAGLRRRGGGTEYATGKSARNVADTVSVEAIAPSIVRCRYCGRKNAAEATYCHECGTELYPKQPQAVHSTPSSAPSPLHWLLGRQRGTQPLLWLAALITASQFGLVAVTNRFLGFVAGTWFVGFYWGVAFVSAAVSGALIAFASSRFVVEARRTGELELLLTTPLGAEKTASTQWDILSRMIRLPLLVMLVPFLVQGLSMVVTGFGPPRFWRTGYALSAILGLANTVLSIGALCWLALWFGFGGMAQGRTIFWAVVWARGLPYGFHFAWLMLCQGILYRLLGSSNATAGLPLLLNSLVPQLITLLFYFFVIRMVRSHLLQHRPGDSLDSHLLLRQALPQIASAIRRARRWPGN